MKISIRILLSVLITLPLSASYSQKIVRVGKSPIVCYARQENLPTKVAPPASFSTVAGRTKSSTIEVEYSSGFTPQAQAAFQFAVDIWESLLSSPVTIRVSANWIVLGNGVLGSAGPTFYASEFAGAPQINVAYPGALAEKLAGQDLNDPSEFDISASFNSDFDWYYNSTGTPGVNQYDLISVVLHELGHGLGFVDTYNFVSGTGDYGSFTDGLPFVYDVNIENTGGTNLYQSFASPSTQLGSQLVSNNLFYNSALAISNNGGQRPKIYAPGTWSGGSSIAHLDENTYPGGNENSLMSPQFADREVIHNPGPITLNLFKDMGWTTVYIDHEPIASTENTGAPAFNVVATVTPDGTPDYEVETSEIFLHYYTSLNANVVSVAMTTTGTPNQYQATLPAPGGTLDYYYYISAEDNLARTITNPGKVNTPLEAPVQGYYKFSVGADIDAPIITHTPVESASFLDSEIEIEVEISERFALSDVHLEYRIASVTQPNAFLTLVDSETNSLTGLTTYSYEIAIPLGSLNDGDIVEYRIVAEDNSSNSNVGISPAANYYEVIYKGIKATQTEYLNDFNATSDDFVGNASDFSIIQPSGFNNPAIHSVHPYEEAGNDNTIDYIYTLRIPIIVQNIGATIKFDEIVLVEPGETGSVFPNQDFYDYVVTEGSTDGGLTWIPVADGYDSRDFSPWLTRYNSSASAIGDPSLYRTRELDLLDQFNEGEELILRFRLYSDPGAAGWGWAIDNLKIQIDDEAPTLLHQHLDFVKSGTTSITLTMEGTDNIAIDKAILEVGVNDQPTEISEELIGESAVALDFEVNIASLASGDKIKYKLSFTDETGNSSTVPSEGFFEVSIVEFETAVNQYANDFNTASNDFVGNFFSIEQPSGFSDDAIHSSHNYPIGFGPGLLSDFTYTLTKPITISSDNPLIRFDEIAIVEGHNSGVVFGTTAFNDYVIVEGSKDEGETWSIFLDGYDAKEQSSWNSTFNNEASGEPDLFRTRLIDMTENGNFDANDEVIIRFRLFSNETLNGWGWAIDNLYIQDAITGTEKELEAAVSVYPNPAKGNITVEASGLSSPYFHIQLLSMHGQNVYSAAEEAIEGKMSHTISGVDIPAGLYLVKISNEGKTVIKKLVKKE